MKYSKLLHNPGAGSGEISGKELQRKIQSAGYSCEYSNLKEDELTEEDLSKVDFIALAGGDGTVRKVARQLIGKNIPMGLLPMGTANNIAQTLNISGNTDEIVKNWSENKIKNFDIGRVSGLEKPRFFLESFGFGLFPRLMTEMEIQNKSETGTTETRLNNALEILYELILKYEARLCRVIVDHMEYTGKFLLVEVMNISSIGPKLNLAPFADPGDGEFDLVMITENQREEFATYIYHKMEGKEDPWFFNIIRCKYLQIFWDGTEVHVDDKNIKIPGAAEVQVKIQEKALQFLLTS